jgi:hypothetical protein
MEELASQVEIEWASTYDGYARIAATPEALWAVVEPAHRHLKQTGEVPGWCGVDLLRAWAFLLTRDDRPPGVGLGTAWFAVLDAISAHPAARLQDLPPTRTD